jgi:hypothetical protein
MVNQYSLDLYPVLVHHRSFPVQLHAGSLALAFCLAGMDRPEHMQWWAGFKVVEEEEEEEKCFRFEINCILIWVLLNSKATKIHFCDYCIENIENNLWYE